MDIDLTDIDFEYSRLTYHSSGVLKFRSYLSDLICLKKCSESIVMGVVVCFTHENAR